MTDRTIYSVMALAGDNEYYMPAAANDKDAAASKVARKLAQLGYTNIYIREVNEAR